MPTSLPTSDSNTGAVRTESFQVACHSAPSDPLKNISSLFKPQVHIARPLAIFVCDGPPTRFHPVQEDPFQVL